MAGAVSFVVHAAALAAQQPTRDTTRVALPAANDSARKQRIDSVVGIRDTLKKRVRRDSIQAPIARSEVPNTIGVGPLYRWTRDSVISTGAINLSDLLDRVPGLTTFRSGFLASAQTAAYLGDLARVRVFRDGLELDALDPRAGGVRDVGDVQLTNVDEVTIERAAGEIRVHLRSWSVRSTTPYTRVDAFTGDEDVNLYRFFYGRRFGSGFDAQVGVQQVGTGTRNRRIGGGGSILDGFARFGWARGRWSADAVYNRLDRERNLTKTFIGQDSVLPRFEGRRNETYLRAAWGDPDTSRAWVQAIASNTRLSLAGTGVLRTDTTAITLTGTRNTPSGLLRAAATLGDTMRTADSAFARRQYVLAGGLTRGPLRISATDRVRAIGGTTYNSPSARASFEHRLFSLAGFAEWSAVGGLSVDTVTNVRSLPAKRVNVDPGVGANAKPDTTTKDTTFTQRYTAVVPQTPSRVTRLDVSGRFTPLPWVALLGSVSRDQARAYDVAWLPIDSTFRDSAVVLTATDRPSVTTTRLEAAVRLGRLWLSGGAIRRGATTLVPPAVYSCLRGSDCVNVAASSPSLAIEAAPVTGTTFGARGPVYKDVYLDATGTVWSSAGAYRPQYQLRGEAGVQTRWLSRFPSGNFGFKSALIDEYRSRVLFPTATTDDPVYAGASNVLTFQLEIRIQTGILSYQLRNALNRQYELVPGFRMPGVVNYYGVRWSFFN